jgi:hypothetical protein
VGVFLSPPDLRVSDAEREAVADFLKRHYAEGRLTDVELSDRIEATYRARRESQLGALIRDLPALDEPQAARRRRVPGIRHAAIALVALVALAFIIDAMPAELSILFLALTLPMLIMVSVMLVPVAVVVLTLGWVARMLGRPRGHGRHRTVW